MDDINERRAEFVYEVARLQAIAVDAPIVPPLYKDREADFKEQFLDVISRQCSDNPDDRFESPEVAHASWVKAYADNGWVYGEVRDDVKRTHPDMVPFDELEQREQDKDAVFLAVCDIARQWIRQ